jgi:hypothetical protein
LVEMMNKKHIKKLQKQFAEQFGGEI